MSLNRLVGTEPIHVTSDDVANRVTWFGKVYTAADAGAAIFNGPASGEAWQVYAVSLHYTADPTVITRYARIRLLGGGFKAVGINLGQIWEGATQNGITSSGAGFFYWTVGGGDVSTANISPGNAYVEAHALFGFPMRDNMGLTALADNSQAGDNWSMNIYGYKYPVNL